MGTRDLSVAARALAAGVARETHSHPHLRAADESQERGEIEVPMASNRTDALRPGELKIQSHLKGGCHTLCLSGELDMVSAAELDSAVTVALAEAREVILDIEELTFIDSTGLRAIITCHKSCQHIDIPFRLTPGQPQAKRLFEVTGLLDLLPFMQPTSTCGDLEAG